MKIASKESFIQNLFTIFLQLLMITHLLEIILTLWSGDGMQVITYLVPLALFIVLYITRSLWLYKKGYGYVVLFFFTFILFPYEWTQHGAVPYYGLLFLFIMVLVSRGTWSYLAAGGFFFLLLFLSFTDYFTLPYQIHYLASGGLLAYVAYRIGHQVRDQQEALIHLSITDPLTGLYNRSYLVKALEEAVNYGQRTKTPFTVVFLNLVGLHDINEIYGYIVGDTVLEEIGKALNKSLRNYDIPARYEGDDFVIIMPGISPEMASKALDRLLQVVGEQVQKQVGFPISWSLGLTNGLHKEVADILKEADYTLR